MEQKSISPILKKNRFQDDMLQRTYLPDCWLDDKRMEVLFAPFRARDTNPEGWDLKMNFWTNLINKWCLHQRRVVFTIDDIRKAMVRGDHYPHIDCLKLVISHMKRHNFLLFHEDIFQRKTNIKSVGRNVASWMVNSLVIKPISLGWSLLTNNRDYEADIEMEQILPNIVVETKLYNRETMDIIVETIESHLKNMKTTCMRYQLFHQFINKNISTLKCIDEQTYDVVMEVLESKGRLSTLEDSGIKIVKFGNEIKINETDISLIKLEATKEILETETDKLADDIEELRVEARQALANKSRDKALLLLKRKKRIESKLNEKDTQIDNIEMITRQLLDTGSQQFIVQAFQMANDVLKQHTSKLDEFENTIANVEDTIGDVTYRMSEINRPISTNDTTMIELDAEEELEEMLKDIENGKKIDNKNDSKENDSFIQKITDLTIIDNDLTVPDNPTRSKKNEQELLET